MVFVWKPCNEHDAAPAPDPCPVNRAWSGRRNSGSRRRGVHPGRPRIAARAVLAWWPRSLDPRRRLNGREKGVLGAPLVHAVLPDHASTRRLQERARNAGMRAARAESEYAPPVARIVLRDAATAAHPAPLSAPQPPTLEADHGRCPSAWIVVASAAPSPAPTASSRASVPPSRPTGPAHASSTTLASSVARPCRWSSPSMTSSARRKRGDSRTASASSTA